MKRGEFEHCRAAVSDRFGSYQHSDEVRHDDAQWLIEQREHARQPLRAQLKAERAKVKRLESAMRECTTGEP